MVVGLVKRGAREGSVIVTDSFFTSVKTFRALRAAKGAKGIGFWAVGTVRVDRGVPRGLTWRSVGRKAHGTARFAVSREGDLLYQQWVDRGLVRVLSTHHRGVGGPPHALADMEGVRKVLRRLGKGEDFHVVEVPQPPAVAAYSDAYGGVDAHDQVSTIACVRVCHRLPATVRTLVLTLCLSVANVVCMYVCALLCCVGTCVLFSPAARTKVVLGACVLGVRLCGHPCVAGVEGGVGGARVGHDAADVPAAAGGCVAIGGIPP